MWYDRNIKNQWEVFNMQAYPAYSENGRIVPIGNPVIPNGKNLIITVLDETAFSHTKPNHEDKQALWEEVKTLYGIIRCDIDEKAELAQAREEKYGRLD